MYQCIFKVHVFGHILSQERWHREDLCTGVHLIPYNLKTIESMGRMLGVKSIVSFFFFFLLFMHGL